MSEDLNNENTNQTGGNENNEGTNNEQTKGLELGNGEGNENNDNPNTDKTDAEVYGSPESYDYSEIQMPEGMTMDNEMLAKFDPIAKKLNLSNKSANELMKLAVEMQSKSMVQIGDIAKEMQENEKNSYLQMLNTDKELNAKSEQDYAQYISTANLGVKSFATEGFKELLKAKGLVNHPEFIKTFHAIGKYCKNDELPNPRIPSGSKKDAATVLYGSSEE